MFDYVSEEVRRNEFFYDLVREVERKTKLTSVEAYGLILHLMTPILKEQERVVSRELEKVNGFIEELNEKLKPKKVEFLD